MHTYLHVTLFVFGGIYSNDHMVCLAIPLYYDNECDNTGPGSYILLKTYLQLLNNKILK